MTASVLIVDDTEENIDILLEALGADYDIRVAMDGVTALETVEDEPPDLILLDIMMPKMDGYEVCARLKSRKVFKDIPIIFVTAMTDVGDEKKGLAMGAVDYITKPFQPDLVKARVKNHLALASAKKDLLRQNKILRENQKLREDVERITRHDMKSPLQVVIACPELIRMYGDLNEEQKNMLTDIEKAGSRLLNMINRSLDLYKMETGVYQFFPEPVDLLPIFDHVVKDAYLISQIKNLGFEFFVDNEPRRPEARFVVNAEPLLCYPLFGNLVANAVEASPQHSNINLSLKCKDGYGEIVVENRGKIPESIQSRFFEKYVTHGKKEGTGLGTYSAKLITETMQGSIRLDVLPNQLVRVCVSLPM